MSKTQKVVVKPAKVSAVSQNEIVKIEQENKPVIREAQALTIRAADDETAAYEVLRHIRQRTDAIEKKRKSIAAPLNASLKEVNTMFKTLASPLLEADSIIRSKILDFRAKREAQAAERQAKILKQAEKAEAKGDEAKAGELQAKAAVTAPIVGDSVVSKRWTFEIEDFSLVPRNFLQVDEKSIREAIRDGVREIAGVKIFQEEQIRVTK
jgi:hypothetical protein